MKMPKSIKELPFKKYDGRGNTPIRYKIDVSLVTIEHERMYLIEFTANPKYKKYNWYGIPTQLKSFRALISKKNKEYRIYEEGKTKTSDKAVDLPQYAYYDINDKSEKLLKRLCSSVSTGNHEIDNLSELMEKWHNNKTAEKRRKSGYIEDSEVYSCPEEYPNGFFDFIQRNIIDEDRTIIYKKGNVRGVCSYCRSNIVAQHGEKFRQNEFRTCPSCGEQCKCVLENSSAWSADNVKNVATMQRGKDGTVWFRQWHVRRDNTARYADLNKYLVEIGRYAVRGEKSAAWTAYYKSPCIGCVVEYKHESWQRYNGSNVYDGDYWFYCDDINAVISGTKLEYSELADYMNNERIISKDPIMYCRKFVKYPVYEFLYKRGYYRIIEQKTKGFGLDEAAHAIGWQKKKLKECFPFPMHYLKIMEPSTWTLEDVKNVKELYNAEISQEDIKLILRSHVAAVYAVQISKYVNVHKVATYLKNQQKLSPDEPLIRLFSIYSDYLEECEKLKLDTKTKSVLFPQNLITSHNNNITLVEAQKHQKEVENFKKAVNKFKKSGYAEGDLMIRAVKNMDELIYEGTALHHCVGSYISKVANGDCMIFFVRRSDEPEQPYYTLELRNKHIIQCRTLNNQSYEANEKVKIFVDKWFEKIISKGA